MIMKKKIGEISGVWSYPVKSMAGHEVSCASYNKLGMIGDRGWSLRDRFLDEIVGAKRLGNIMQLRAEYCTEAKHQNDIPAVRIFFPDGSSITSENPEAQPLISAYLGRQVELRQLEDNKKYYQKHSMQPNLAALRHELGMLPNDNMENLGSFPLSMLVKLGKYVTPPFTHYDDYPIHFLTSATLAWLQQNNPEAQIDIRRFRPNFLVDTLSQAPGFVEKQWSGGYLEIGSAVIKVECPTIRCSMPSQAQPELKKDNKVATAIRLTAKQFVGSYGTVIEEGDILVGDSVRYRPVSKLVRATARLQKNVRKSLLTTALAVLEKKPKEQLTASVEDKLLKQGFTRFKVFKTVCESQTVTSFYLTPQSGAELIPYLSGQHIMLALNIPNENMPVVRAYSLSLGSSQSNSYRISVKREKAPENCHPNAAGKASNYLHDQIHKNDPIYVKGPAGQFYLPPKALLSPQITNNKSVALISMGIGITPMFSMLEQAIQNKYDQKFYFIHGTQGKSSHLFKDQLNVYAEIENVKMHTSYSQPNVTDILGIDYHDHSRINIELIREIIPSLDTSFYLCGTQTFMREIYAGLIDWGVNKDDIHYEYFKKAKPLEITQSKALSYDVFFKRSDVKAIWSSGSGSLLDLAEECGISPEYGCRYGACEACSANLISGQVDHDENVAQLKTSNSILLCSARPSSDIEIEL